MKKLHVHKKSLKKKDMLKLFPKLDDNINKGDMGRVLCVCGTVDQHGIAMCGAAYFSATAAYRCGAGIVEIFTEKTNYAPLAASVPEAVFSLYEMGEDAADVCARLAGEMDKADSVVLGCGIGKSELSRQLVITALGHAKCPILIDADALNIISEDQSLWELLSEEQKGRTVITPHIGEMARLAGKTVDEIKHRAMAEASEFAFSHGITCVLKGHNTVITNGKYADINHSGNAGMATAGMGDVLAGIIGALLARPEDHKFDQKKSHKAGASHDPILYRAAVGTYLHGFAGDIAAKKVGVYPLMSSDVLKSMNMVFAKKKKLKEYF